MYAFKSSKTCSSQTKEGKQNKQKKYMDLKGHQDEVFVDKMTQFKLEISKLLAILMKGRFFEFRLRFVDPELI